MTMRAHPIHPTRYPHLAVVAGRPVEHRSRDARHYHIERVPLITSAATFLANAARAVVFGALLLGLIYGTLAVGAAWPL